jgi:hypothetical protein
MVVEIVERSQRTKSNRAGFGGSGVKVYAVIREASAEPVGSHPLSLHNCTKFGWKAVWCGDGYGNHTGPRSSLYKARKQAEWIKHNTEAGIPYAGSYLGAPWIKQEGVANAPAN